MKSTVLVSLLAIALTGCQVSVRLGGSSGVTHHTHEAPAPSSSATPDAAPTPASTAAAPVAAEPAEACPAVPAPIECPTPEPAITTSSDEQTSTQTANTEAVDSKESSSDDTNEEQSQQAESQDSSQPTEVVADEKPTAPSESFDIDKYVEQSSSCVQQHPCNQPQVEVNNSQEPKAAEEAKVIEQTKPPVPATTDAVQERKPVVRDTGIQRVDRRRPVLKKSEMPPDMPR